VAKLGTWATRIADDAGSASRVPIGVLAVVYRGTAWMVVVVVVACGIVVDVVLAGGGTVVVVARVGCGETVAAVPSEPSPEHAAVTSDTVAATIAIALVPRRRCAVSAPIRWRSIRRRWYFTGPPVDRMHEVQISP